MKQLNAYQNFDFCTGTPKKLMPLNLAIHKVDKPVLFSYGEARYLTSTLNRN